MGDPSLPFLDCTIQLLLETSHWSQALLPPISHPSFSTVAGWKPEQAWSRDTWHSSVGFKALADSDRVWVPQLYGNSFDSYPYPVRSITASRSIQTLILSNCTAQTRILVSDKLRVMWKDRGRFNRAYATRHHRSSAAPHSLVSLCSGRTVSLLHSYNTACQISFFASLLSLKSKSEYPNFNQTNHYIYFLN
jgi:hypothetical protein